MTIKQQGGIFGRNPSFNDVDVNKLDVDNIQIDGSTISSTNSNGNVLIDPNGTGNVVIPNAAGNTYAFLNGGNSTAGGSNPWLATLNNADPASATFGWSFYNNDVNGNLDLYVTSSGVSSRIMTFTRSTGHADLTGNLAFASGQGIDFSATSGTGTSELFDDYEEGTFTPSYSAATGTFTTLDYTTQQGYYTKVGNVVTFFVYIQTSNVNVGSASGELKIDGLPYTAASAAPLDSYAGVGATVFSRRWALAADIQNLSGIGVVSNTNTVQLQKTTMNTSTVGRLQVSDLTTGAASSRNSLSIAGHYYVP